MGMESESCPTFLRTSCGGASCINFLIESLQEPHSVRKGPPLGMMSIPLCYSQPVPLLSYMELRLMAV